MAKKKVAKKATKKVAKKAPAKAPAKKKAAAKKATSTPKKAAPKKPAAKKSASSGGGFNKAHNLSAELQAVLGKATAARTEVTKGLWAYIKKHNLQDSKNKRNINTDDKLKAVFGKAMVNMFEMTKLVGKHLS